MKERKLWFWQPNWFDRKTDDQFGKKLIFLVIEIVLNCISTRLITLGFSPNIIRIYIYILV